MKIFEDNNLVLYACRSIEEAREISQGSHLNPYNKIIFVSGITIYLLCIA